MTIHNKLSEIQVKAKAPKAKKNNFGKYMYRNLEDSLEAIKPILDEYKCHLTFDDDIVLVGDRYYLKAVAKITDEKGDSISTSALAREPENKKGMDSQQVTGASSTYARKVALGGLLALDDSQQDPDMTNKGGSVQALTLAQLNSRGKKLLGDKWNKETFDRIASDFSMKNLKEAANDQEKLRAIYDSLQNYK